MKWNKVSKRKIGLIKKIIDAVFSTPGIKFSAIIINKDKIDFAKKFQNDPYKAYQDFSEILLKMGVGKNEILIVLADYITTPKEIHFEFDVKRNINFQFSRLAIAGIHRIDSDCTNMLQINDLFLGAAIYDYKVKHKIVSGDRNKKVILKYIKKKLGAESFVGGYRGRDYRVIEYLDNKKGPSS